LINWIISVMAEAELLLVSLTSVSLVTLVHLTTAHYQVRYQWSCHCHNTMQSNVKTWDT